MKTARSYKYPLVITCLVVILAGFASVMFFRTAMTSNPVPLKIRKTLSFTPYYPDMRHLPASYTLSSTFSSPEKDVLLFSLIYDTTKRMIISEQQYPSDAILQEFYANYIPLRNAQQVQLGTAQIGAFGSGDNLQTIISLPINNGPWLIVTAPPSITSTQIKQTLDSFKR